MLNNLFEIFEFCHSVYKTICLGIYNKILNLNSLKKSSLFLYILVNGIFLFDIEAFEPCWRFL